MAAAGLVGRAPAAAWRTASKAPAPQPGWRAGPRRREEGGAGVSAAVEGRLAPRSLGSAPAGAGGGAPGAGPEPGDPRGLRAPLRPGPRRRSRERAGGLAPRTGLRCLWERGPFGNGSHA